MEIGASFVGLPLARRLNHKSLPHSTACALSRRHDFTPTIAAVRLCALHPSFLMPIIASTKKAHHVRPFSDMPRHHSEVGRRVE